MCIQVYWKYYVVYSQTMSSVSDNLFGAYTHKLDPKNRIAIPTEWRPSEGCALLLLSGQRLELPTVKAYTREKFQQIIDKIESTAGYTEAQIDLFIGKLYANCVEVIINSQGKLLIPKHMCEHAHLSSSVRLVARRGYFELWEPSLYEEVSQRENASISDINKSFGIL